MRAKALGASRNRKRRQPKLALNHLATLHEKRERPFNLPSLSGLLLVHVAACEENLRNRVRPAGMCMAGNF